MSDGFDPYHVWLGIPPKEQPPNRYRLLGIDLFEANPDVISSAADRQMAHLRTFQSGQHSRLTQRLLNEVSVARVSLLNPEKKAAYDRQLRAALPVAERLAEAPSDAAAQPATDWDNLIGGSLSAADAAHGKSRQSKAASRSTGKRLIFAGVAAVALLAAACSIAWFALSGPADAALKFDWPAADRAGATLTIDDQPVSIPADGPWEYRCSPGEHRIAARRGAFKFETTASVAAGDEQTIAVDWKPRAVVVLNWPLAERSGGALLIDGRPQRDLQREPLRLPVEPGPHVIRVTRPEAEPFETTVSLADGQNANVAIVLRPWPTLVVDLPVAFRRNATLSIDDHPATLDSSAATLGFRVAPGPHTIHVTRPGFQPFDKVATIDAGDNPPIRPVWQPLVVIRKPTRENTLPVQNPAIPDKAAPVKKLPIPTAAAQADSLKLVKETFKSEFAKKLPADEAALAKKLFDAALETKDDPTGRFVLLGAARDLAVRTGNLDTTTQAIDQLTAEYAIDALPIKAKALTEIAKTFTTSAGNNNALMEAFIAAVEEAIGADQYAIAQQLLTASKPVSRRSIDKQLVARLDHLSKDVATTQKHFEEIAPALETLKQQPNDPDANLTVGKFLCFWKGHWDEGLPLLAKGNDPKLKDVITREQSHPGAAAEQFQLADALWALAEAEPDPVIRHLKLRAAHWYDLAMPGLSGFDKARAEQRIHEAGPIAVAPAPGAAPNAAANRTFAQRLPPGEQLKAGDLVEAPNKQYRLELQTDGNLVLYHMPERQTRWATNTSGSGGVVLKNQVDGGLVIYTGDGRAIWASSATTPKSTLSVDDDGLLRLFDSDGRLRWRTR